MCLSVNEQTNAILQISIMFSMMKYRFCILYYRPGKISEIKVYNWYFTFILYIVFI